ncbi:MAG: hypothetical protein NZ556_09325 [Fimbriimonadales bacterium]|nr:hypothetical protein [Fimbriimonadales bacterium]
MERDYNELEPTHAAAQLPVPETPAPSAGAAETNGVASERALEPKPTGYEPSPLIAPYPNAAPFWHLPLEPTVFYDTPLLAHQQLADAERIVLQLESYLRKAGYEVEAHELRMQYTHWVKIPATQYELLRAELEPLRKEYQQSLQETNQSLEQAKQAFMQAMATARIPLPDAQPQGKRRHAPPQPELITPALVERALRADFASDDEVCGEQGVAPVSSRSTIWTTVGQWLFEFFAPLAAGLLLGVNLGVITGLLSLEVLQRGESLWIVALAAVIGLFVEKLVGNTAYSLASSAAQASERRENIDAAAPFPTMRSLWRVALFAVVTVVLTVAIATVDALGLHMLYTERRQEAQLTGGASGEEVPLWVFFIAGLIISAPYIVYKAVKGWREPEIRQREARVAYLHWKHVERRREEPAVQRAFEQAQVVQNLEERRARLQSELERMEARLDAARTECIGSTQKFRAYWDELIAWLSQQQRASAFGYSSAASSRRPRRQSGETLLQKLLGLFRR